MLIFTVLWWGWISEIAAPLKAPAILISSLPWLWLLRPIMDARPRAMLIIALFSLVYLSHGIMEFWAVNGDKRLWAALEVFLCINIFAACFLYMRSLPRQTLAA